MTGHSVDDGKSSSQTKIGGARTSKKPKRRNVIRFTEWSGKQKSVNSKPMGPQQHAQDLEKGAGTSSHSAGETVTPEIPAKIPEITPLLDHQIKDASSDDCVTVHGSLSPPDDQDDNVPPLELQSLAKVEHTKENHEMQVVQEELEADDWPSENMRVNAQNLRYGGYSAQPAPQNRNTPLGSGRLQNTTKLGTPDPLLSCLLQENADAFWACQVMAQTGASEHL